MVLLFPILFNEFSSPSRSLTKISGMILFSIRAFTAPSATIFVVELYFFKVGRDDKRVGPAPITKTS